MLAAQKNDRMGHRKAMEALCMVPIATYKSINSLSPRQYGGYFADGILKCIFVYESFHVLIRALIMKSL